jgi:oligoendopeptidase F
MQQDSTVNGLDIHRLPARQKRVYVPQQADFSDPTQVETLYLALLARPLKTGADLEAFLLHRSELEAAIRQHRSVLYVQMTCQTDDPERAALYRKFVEQIQPVIERFTHQLNTTYLNARDRIGQGPVHYAVYERNLRADAAIFRQENIPLQVEESLLSQEYQTVTGGLTAQFEGQEVTLSKLATFLYEPDRSRREKAWRTATDCYYAVRDTLDDIFDKMLELRGRIAGNAGFANYRDYKFREYHRFDYTPEDCKAFHSAIQKILVPLQCDMWHRRSEEMRLHPLRPWDLVADTHALPPLKPFEQPNDFIPAMRILFEHLDPELGARFAQMQELGLLDLLSRKGKAPGGYQCTLDEARKPFIFMNAAGSDDDVRVLLHESGHAFHALASADEPLADYRHAPMEFCEVASMSMELLALPQLGVFYNADQQRRRRRLVAESTVRLLLAVAVNDAFQHWLYEVPGRTRGQRCAKWIELQNAYGQNTLDWAGLEQYRGFGWHRILHFFQVPFYYIEYGIAQLGALGMWRRSKTDFASALRDYKKALTLGGSRPLPELFAAAGLTFDFSENTIRQAADLLRNEWESTL